MVKVGSNTIFTDDSVVSQKERRKPLAWFDKLRVLDKSAGSNTLKRVRTVDEPAGLQATDREIEKKNDLEFEQSGINTHTIKVATKKEDDLQIVEDLVKKSNRNIISITSTFPFDFFPSTIDVEEGRVTFKFNQFLSSQSHSVDVKDISNVFIESSIFFATLQVVSRTFHQNDIKIGNLNKAKAVKVQSIIEGLRTFVENDINTSDYEIDELISKIGEFHTNQGA